MRHLKVEALNKALRVATMMLVVSFSLAVIGCGQDVNTLIQWL